MALKTILETIRAARSAYLAQLDKGGKAMQAQLGEQVAAIMATLPEDYTHLTWTQYTPYFNDGDPCLFRANEPTLCKAGPAPDGDDAANIHSWPTNGLYISPYYLDNTAAAAIAEPYAQLLALWKELDDEALESAFGDHVRVVIRRDGSWFIGRYDHD